MKGFYLSSVSGRVQIHANGGKIARKLHWSAFVVFIRTQIIPTTWISKGVMGLSYEYKKHFVNTSHYIKNGDVRIFYSTMNITQAPSVKKNKTKQKTKTNIFWQ